MTRKRKIAIGILLLAAALLIRWPGIPVEEAAIYDS